MAPRKNGQAASWEVDADKPKPAGETRARRSYCVKDLVTSECRTGVIRGKGDSKKSLSCLSVRGL